MLLKKTYKFKLNYIKSGLGSVLSSASVSIKTKIRRKNEIRIYVGLDSMNLQILWLLGDLKPHLRQNSNCKLSLNTCGKEIKS
jgi:hypothetical protein